MVDQSVGQMTAANAPQRQLTLGERLVGIGFNPSNDDAVSKAKRLFAEITDLVQSEREGKEASSMLDNILYNHTIGEILNAQMNVVKLLTLKY